MSLPFVSTSHPAAHVDRFLMVSYLLGLISAATYTYTSIADLKRAAGSTR